MKKNEMLEKIIPWVTVAVSAIFAAVQTRTGQIEAERIVDMAARIAALEAKEEA